MKSALHIGLHEFVQNLRSRSYLLATFGAPLLILGLTIAFGVQKTVPLQEQQTLNIALLDETNTVKTPELFHKETYLELQRQSPTQKIFQWMTRLPRNWMAVANRDEIKKKLLTGELDGALIITNLENGSIGVVLQVAERRLHLAPLIEADVDWLFSRWLKENLKPHQAAVFLNPTPPAVEWLDDAGHVHQTDLPRTLLAENEKSSWVHVGVFLLAVMLLSGYLVVGLADEREQKTLEYILTLVTPFELLTGKLLGIVMSGLLQVITWGITFVFPALFFVWSMKHAFINWLFPFLFFFSGYVFYGGALLSLSSSASSARESRQTAASWFMLNLIPLAFYPHILGHPDSWLARVFSYIPVTAPITMMFRLGLQQASAVDIMISLGLLWTATLLLLKLASTRILTNLLRRV